jgi:hypothetical protein
MATVSALLLELLDWIDARPRTYGETMEVWRTSCPQMPIWEDATMAGLVEVATAEGTGQRDAPVRLTAAGRAARARARDGAA